MNVIDNSKKEKIALEVIRTLKTKFDDFPEDFFLNRNAPFHEAFLKAFSVKLENRVQSVSVFISLAKYNSSEY